MNSISRPTPPRADILSHALKSYGLAEVAGTASSPEIMGMAKALGSSYPSDETSWCGLAMAYWLTQAGGTPPKGYLAARTWLNSGEAVDGAPELGDVCVLWRIKPDSWEGHVAVFVARRGHLLYLLGGNQGNVVGITSFPEAMLLGFRRYPVTRHEAKLGS